MRNQLYPHWDRSSAHTPEVLGALNGAITQGVQRAYEIFEESLLDIPMTDEERADVRAEVLPIIAAGITDGIAEFAESLKH